MTRPKVLSVVSEVYPLIKTGGLADVAGALPRALVGEGVDMVTLIPGYPAITAQMKKGEIVLSIPHLFGAEARVVAGKAGGLDLMVLDAPHLFARPGNPYSGPDGRDWIDNPFRFAALCRTAAEIGLGAVPGFVPDVVHAHDWQGGLAAAYLTYSGKKRPGTVITVHNMAFQGQYPPELLATLGLPAHAFAMDGVEYYGTIGYLKAGLQLSDRITTVSPTYAAEIRTANAGMGLEGLLRARAPIVSGILNGIDDEVWNPATDASIAAPFDVANLRGRPKNKAALQKRFGLEADRNALLFGVVSRLSWQKGLDLLLECLPILLGQGAQLVVLGTGEKLLEDAYLQATATHPGRIGCVLGYDEKLAHLLQAGTDALLVPSRFEPCGLTQLCALRYGSVPVAARVGGLADSIVDANEMARAGGAGTGVLFSPVGRDMLEAALQRTADLWRDKPAWKRLQKNGMKTDVSWRLPAGRYASLYRDLIGHRPS